MTGEIEIPSVFNQILRLRRVRLRSGCLFLQHSHQILRILALAREIDEFLQSSRIDEFLREGDFFHAGDFQALALFERLDENANC